MFNIYSCFYLLFLILTFFEEFSFGMYGEDPGEVIFVSVIFRHGDRSPIETFENDQYNSSYWPMGWGQLTNNDSIASGLSNLNEYSEKVNAIILRMFLSEPCSKIATRLMARFGQDSNQIGKKQHYEFGQYMRKRYSKLLPEQYNRSDIYVESTDVDRTLMSAESHLAGLYPPVGAQKWDPYINWQPIPIHTIPEDLDYILSMKKPCERYEHELKAAKSSSFMRLVNQKYEGLYDSVSLHSGKKIKDVVGLSEVYDVLLIENIYNLSLPDWAEKVFPEPMKTVSAISFMLPSLTSEMKRLKGGPLIGKILKLFVMKSTGKLKPDRKYWIFSAHDSTISAVLMAFDLFNSIPPPYTAAVIFELRKNSLNQYFVSLLYRNSSDHPPFNLTLAGCSFYCPLDQFSGLVKPLIPEDWQSECESAYSVSSMVMHNLLIVSLLVSLITLITALTIVQWKRNFMVHRAYRKLSAGVM